MDLPSQMNIQVCDALSESRLTYPDPWADPKSRSTLGFQNLPIGVLDSRIGGSTFWILPGVWVRPKVQVRGSLDSS